MFRSTIPTTTRLFLRRSAIVSNKRFPILQSRLCATSTVSYGIKSKYVKLLKERPILMQAIQTGILMALGDAIAQLVIEKRRSDYSLMRTAKFGTIGFFYIGPAVCFWYRFLDSKIIYKTPVVRMLAKVACDQICFAPIFVATIVGLVGVMQSKSPSSIRDKLKSEFSDILKANYMVWPWVQMVNFGLVPLQYQVLVAQLVAVFWNTFIAWRTNVNDDDSNKHNEVL